jgi:Predicted transcriptional regulators
MDIPNELKIGATIKKFRKEKRMKLIELAELAGISHSYLSQIENGKKQLPSRKVLEQIAINLHVPFHEFIEEAGGSFLDESPDDGDEEREHNAEIQLTDFRELSDYLQYVSDIKCDGVLVSTSQKEQILDFARFLMTKKGDII